LRALVQKIPFLRISIAFAFGILGARWISVPATVSGFLCIVVLAAFIFLHKKYSYRYEFFSGWLIALLFLLLGASYYASYNTPPKFYSTGKFAGTILEKPKEKSNSYKSLIALHAVFNDSTPVVTREKILVYFAKTSKTQTLNPGDVIVFSDTPHMVRNSGAPYAFDYKSFLERKKIYRQVYLKDNNWRIADVSYASIWVKAERTREKLLGIYRAQNLGANETEIFSALTLGYKRGLDPETKRVFSAAGAMHVLAVSGLHVGIVYGVFVWLLGFLRKRKSGRIVFVAGALLLLWAYAFVTGLSPSVMRSATMFSLMAIATGINRKTSVYNSLAIAAFVSLVVNPNNLWEVGFQLSFIAVFGIVFLQPRLEKLWPVRNRILRYSWTIFTVSVAAQIATFPVTSYYFGQFSVYFWLTNLVVIPVAFLLIVLGISLLIFSPFPFISSLLSVVIQWTIHSVYSFLKFVEHLPMSTLGISLSFSELLPFIVALLFAFVFMARPRMQALKLMFIFLLITGCVTLGNRYSQIKTKELIVYTNPENPAIHLICGQCNYVVSEKTLEKDTYLFRQIENVTKKKHLSDPEFLLKHTVFENEHLLVNNNLVGFCGKTIFLGVPSAPFPEGFCPEYILVRNLKRIENLDVRTTTRIISFESSSSCNDRPVYSLRKQGAYRIQWR